MKNLKFNDFWDAHPTEEGYYVVLYYTGDLSGNPGNLHARVLYYGPDKSDGHIFAGDSNYHWFNYDTFYSEGFLYFDNIVDHFLGWLPIQVDGSTHDDYVLPPIECRPAKPKLNFV